MKQEEEERLKLRTWISRPVLGQLSTLSCVVFVGFLLLGLVYFVLLRDITARAGGSIVTGERGAASQIVR